MVFIQDGEWAVQWKMNFNPDPSKQAQELLFSRKISSKPYPSLNFNDSSIPKALRFVFRSKIKF